MEDKDYGQGVIPERKKCQGRYGTCTGLAEHPYCGNEDGPPVLCWPCFIYDCTH